MEDVIGSVNGGDSVGDEYIDEGEDDTLDVDEPMVETEDARELGDNAEREDCV